MSKKGKITQIIGAVVDVNFGSDLPEIYTALEVDNSGNINHQGFALAAFAISELADFAVYTPLQKRGLIRAVFASSIVGLALDSIIFLYLAFGSLAFIEGQIIGKLIMVVLAIPVIRYYRDNFPNPETT